MVRVIVRHFKGIDKDQEIRHGFLVTIEVALSNGEQIGKDEFENYGWREGKTIPIPAEVEDAILSNMDLTPLYNSLKKAD